MKTTLHELITQSNTPVIIDGGMGTMLFDLGLQHGDSPEEWNVSHPENIASVHQEYLEAGSQIILTNTFGGNRLRLELHNFSDRVAEFNHAAAQVARKVADAADKPVLVAGSIGPTGGILMPYGVMEFDEAKSAFAEQASALIDGGVDVLWIETMSDLEEVRVAVEGIRSVSADFPIVATMTFDTNGHTMFGVAPEQALEKLSEFGVVALGGNCGNGPDEISDVIGKMQAANPNVPLIAKANAGIPHLESGVAVYDGTPEIMAEYAITVRNLGASIIGACCGSTPAHIKAMADALGQAEPV